MLKLRNPQYPLLMDTERQLRWNHSGAFSSLLRILISMWILVLGFTGVRFGHDYLLPFVVVGMVAFPVLILQVMQRGKFRRFIVQEDILLLGLLFWIALVAIYHQTNKSGNYLAAYVFIFGFNYLVMRTCALESCSASLLLRVNMWAVGIVCAISLSEFIVANFFDSPLLDMLNAIRFQPASAETPFFLAERLKRSYALSSEPTTLAEYLGTLGPLALWYCWQTKKSILRNWCYSLLVVAGFLVTFSSAGMACITAAIILASLIVMATGFSRRMLFNIGTAGVAILVIVSVSVSQIGVDRLMEIGAIYKLVSWQMSDRYESIIRGLSQIAETPFMGVGLGVHSEFGNSILSWYVLLGAEAGLFPVFMVVSFFILTIGRITYLRIPGRFYFLVGFLESIFHLATMAVFFMPPPWALLIIYHVYSTEVAPKNTYNKLAGGYRLKT